MALYVYMIAISLFSVRRSRIDLLYPSYTAVTVVRHGTSLYIVVSCFLYGLI